MAELITVRNIQKTFADNGGKISALADIDIAVAEGEFLVFVGPSGSGKSTLLRIMSGLDQEYNGELQYAENLKRSEISFVFQQFALFPWLTVEENIGFGLAARNMPEKERREIIKKELNEFGLESFARVPPRDLSGGMKQRVGIARALATAPRVVFMDEPFSELDSFTADELRKELLTLWHARKMTIIMVTHIVEEAILLADRIAVLTPRPGRIEKIIKNDLPRPRVERSQDFYDLEDKITKIIRP